MTQTIVEITPTNKAHTTEHKSISDYSFYGIVNQIEKELSEGWEINNQEYPIFTGTLYTVAFKRAKGLQATLAPPSSVKGRIEPASPANGAVAKAKEGLSKTKEPSVRRKATLQTKVVAKAPAKDVAKAVLTTPAVVDSAPDKFTYKEI